MSKFSSVLMIFTILACSERNHSPSPSQPVTPVVNPTPPPSGGMLNEPELPEVKAYHQEGLKQVIVEFSKPILRIEQMTRTPGIEEPTWDETRRFLTAKFDVTKMINGLKPNLFLSRFFDDANVGNLKGVSIPIDNAPPSIDNVKVIDSHKIMVVLNEETDLSRQSSALLDGVNVGSIESDRANKKQIVIDFPDVDLSILGSHQLILTQLTDVYGNIASEIKFGFSKDKDAGAPEIQSVLQVKTTRTATYTYLTFELEFSEYVVDSRDTDGKEPSIKDILDSSGFMLINGTSVKMDKAIWKPRSDHRGGSLQISSYYFAKYFLNGKANTIGLTLEDTLGNSHVATKEFIVDSAAPVFVGNEDAADQCEMVGTQSFRCEITEADIETAVLAPERTWDSKGYSVRTTIETVNGKTRNWLNFDFKTVVPEEPIVAIMTVDKFDNTNLDQDIQRFFFRPSTNVPELKTAMAFSNSVLELNFSEDIGSIDKVLVDNIVRKFDLTFVDRSLSIYQRPNAIIHFEDYIPDGLHDIELQGVSRARNKAVKVDSFKLESIDNRIQNVLESTISQKPDLFGTSDLRFEMTRPLGDKLLLFSRFRDSSGEIVTKPIEDFTLTPEGQTHRGTYAVRLHKKTAANLPPNADEIQILLNVPGRSGISVYVRWSTKEPRFYIPGRAKPSGFKVQTPDELELDSLSLEVFDRNQVIQIDRSWISPYRDETSGNHGFEVRFPNDIRLKAASYSYKFRAKKAKTSIFGIDLTQPFETYLSVE